MLYLVHHAEAVGPEVDPQRPLSLAGRMHADALASRARERGVQPAAIWHSGKLRARQTADAFWRACNPLAELSAVRGLQPTDPPEWMCDRLAGDPRDIMVVGHMPALPRLFSSLVRSPDAAEFPPHGLVALALENGEWIERFRLG